MDENKYVHIWMYLTSIMMFLLCRILFWLMPWTWWTYQIHDNKLLRQYNLSGGIVEHNGKRCVYINGRSMPMLIKLFLEEILRHLGATTAAINGTDYGPTGDNYAEEGGSNDVARFIESLCDPSKRDVNLTKERSFIGLRTVGFDDNPVLKVLIYSPEQREKSKKMKREQNPQQSK